MVTNKAKRLAVAGQKLVLHASFLIYFQDRFGHHPAALRFCNLALRCYAAAQIGSRG
jgi:hypothetical protein